MLALPMTGRQDFRGSKSLEPIKLAYDSGICEFVYERRIALDVGVL